MIHYLTSTIEEMFGKKSKAKKKEETLVGMELENELKVEPPKFIGIFGHFSHPSTTWKTVAEGSLRYYGHEFVSKPLTVNGMRQSLKNLWELVRGQLNCEPYFHGKPEEPIPFTSSRRTSVHTHFDVGKYQVIDLVLFLGLYYILEVFLSRYCGKHRQGNLFCLRAKDAHYVINELRLMLEDKANLSELPLCHENLRYGSVNFASLYKFGTIEFRLMRGVSTPDDAITWLDALEAVRQYALRFTSTDEMVRWFQQTPAGEIPLMVFGEELLGRLTPADYSASQLADDVREGWLTIAPVLWVPTEPELTEERLAEWKKMVEDALAHDEVIKERVKTEIMGLKSFQTLCVNHGYDPSDYYRLIVADVHHNIGAGFRACLKEIGWDMNAFMKLFIKKAGTAPMQPVPLGENHPPAATDYEEETISPTYDIYGNPITVNQLPQGSSYWSANLNLIANHTIMTVQGNLKVGDMNMSMLESTFRHLQDALHTFFPSRKGCQQLINYLHFCYRQQDPYSDVLTKQNFSGVWANGIRNAFNPKYVWRIADGSWVYHPQSATENPAADVVTTPLAAWGALTASAGTTMTLPDPVPEEQIPMWDLPEEDDYESDDDDYHEFDDDDHPEDEDLA